MRQYPLYNRFNRGEIDEQFASRIDLEGINDTASLMENWEPSRLGSMMFRRGTEHLSVLGGEV